MAAHIFNKSKKIEDKYAHLHTELLKSLANGNNSKFSIIKIDRDKCDYQTKEGKVYQQADTDVIVTVESIETKAQKEMYISEKVRKTSYNDIYLEAISIFKLQKDNSYKIEAEGWGLKKGNYSPGFLSLIFLDEKNNTYKGVFIGQYQKLKEKIFYQQKLDYLIQGVDFNLWLESQIKIAQTKGKSSFSLSPQINMKSKYGIEKIIFALNKNNNESYYTIGMIFNTELIKKIVGVNNFKETKGMIKKLPIINNNQK